MLATINNSPRHPGVPRGWSRLVTAIDRSQFGAHSLEGAWLNDGRADLSEGAIVVINVNDADGDAWLRIYRAEGGRLVEVGSGEICLSEELPRLHRELRALGVPTALQRARALRDGVQLSLL